MLLSLPIFRKPSYEIFLRSHQALTFLCAYALWRHLSSKWSLARICFYVSTGILGVTSFLQLCSILHRNVSLRRGFPRAQVNKIGAGIKITVVVPYRLQVKAG